MLKEFKEFIAQGNVLDLAIGIIIGAAFGEIVNSLVDNIIMPIVGLFMGGIDFTGLFVQIKDVEIAYGMFIQNVVSFFIIAFSIFLLFKLIHTLFIKQDVIEDEV